MLKIITADERLAQAREKNSFAIFGKWGVGKTSLIYTLPEDSTLFIDMESGAKSAQTWRGDLITIRSFRDALDLICLVGGPDQSVRPEDPFSAAHYEAVRENYSSLDVARYKTVFFDSISDLTHAAMNFAKQQPSAKSEKTGRDDVRGMYGELGRQVVATLRHLQHAPKNTIFVGRLKHTVDDFGASHYEPEMLGNLSARELPGIVDNVFTMSFFDLDETGAWSHNIDRGAYRAFVCRSPNPWALPAKTRSEFLEMVEEPNLGKILAKINRDSAISAKDRQFELARQEPQPATALEPKPTKAKAKSAAA